MQRVLVTGGAGYIGSILVPRLLAHGFQVTVVDKFMFGQDSLSAVCYHPCFDLVRGDVRDHDVMRPLLKTADIIIPLAALVGAPLCDRDPLAATSTGAPVLVRDQDATPSFRTRKMTRATTSLRFGPAALPVV